MQALWGLDYPCSVPPQVKLVGSLLAEDAKKLPNEFQAWMDAATEGVVVVSTGTTITVPEEDLKKTYQALSKLPFKVLWKEKKINGLPDKLAPNVRIESWIPQNDILAHPNTRGIYINIVVTTLVFLTHCGMNGMMESCYQGVPMVGLPRMADQFDNCQKVYSSGLGLVVDRDNFTPELLKHYIMQVATVSNYTIKAKKVSHLAKEIGGVNGK
jgi:UDP:flavonoid glycosyltransferase YjiC (YdhE family)